MSSIYFGNGDLPNLTYWLSHSSGRGSAETDSTCETGIRKVLRCVVAISGSENRTIRVLPSTTNLAIAPPEDKSRRTRGQWSTRDRQGLFLSFFIALMRPPGQTQSRGRDRPGRGAGQARRRRA